MYAMVGTFPAAAIGPMSAPPPPAAMSGIPSGVSRAAICCIIVRAAALPVKPSPAGAKTPESDSWANTWFPAAGR